MTGGGGSRQERGITQGQEKTFGSEDCVLYLDCSDSLTVVNSLKPCPIGLMFLFKCLTEILELVLQNSR